MAGGLWALLDDVVSLLDDVALLAKSAASKSSKVMDDVTLMAKSATGKTAGVIGDDLAVSASSLTGFAAQRELPILWAVAKGSLRNKALIVPLALLINALLPPLLNWVLLLGGAFLCYEGVEKLAHRGQPQPTPAEALPEASLEALQALEAERIRAAIQTDFILSLEIIVIALSDVVARGAGWGLQLVALAIISLLLTALVYGSVAVIVKLDDLGLYLQSGGAALRRASGRALLWLAPQIVRLLSWAGTVAVFLVGGHIWQEHTPLGRWHSDHWLGGALLTLAVGLLIGALGYGLQRLLARGAHES